MAEAPPNNDIASKTATGKQTKRNVVLITVLILLLVVVTLSCFILFVTNDESVSPSWSNLQEPVSRRFGHRPFRHHHHDKKKKESNCHPNNIHMSPANNVNWDDGSESAATVQMTLSFTLSYPFCKTTANATATVFYGKVNSKNNDTKIYEAKPTEQLHFDFHGYLNKKFSSNWIHHVPLPKLQAGLERYWYKIQIGYLVDGSTPAVVSSAIHTFLTPPMPSSPTRMALVGDWGGTEDSVETMNGVVNAASATATKTDERYKRHSRSHHHTNSDPLSAIIVAGDLSYANSNLPHWESWLTKMVRTLQIHVLSVVCPFLTILSSDDYFFRYSCSYPFFVLIIGGKIIYCSRPIVPYIGLAFRSL